MKKPFKNGSVATAIESCLIAALIAVVITSGVTVLGANIDTKFGVVSTEVANAKKLFAREFQRR